MSSVPSEHDFAAHGLYEVELDDRSRTLTPSTNPSTSDRETRICGRALWRPVPAYPPSPRAAARMGPEGMRVRFRLAPASNLAGEYSRSSTPSGVRGSSSGLEGELSKLTLSASLPPSGPALDHFRRNHQLLSALFGPDFSSPNPIPGQPRPQGRPSSPSPSFSSLGATPLRSASAASSNRNTLTQQALPEPKPSFLPCVDRIGGWWQDSFGGWMIGPDDEQSTTLEAYWSTLLQGEAGGMQGLTLSERDEAREAMKVYGDASEVLIQVAEVLQSLNDRRLALAVARPDFFHVNLKPTDPRLPPQVELIRVATCVQLPGFSWDNISTPVVQQSPSLGTSIGSPAPSVSLSEVGGIVDEDVTATMQPLRTARDPDGDAGGLYDEKLLKKHLRFLAPETVSSRRVSPVGDVFSFGVLAYELIVGRTTETSDGAEVDLLSDIHRHLTVDLRSPLAVLTSPNSPTSETFDLGSPQSDRPPRSVPLPPKALSDIVMKCVAKDLDDRYGSIRSLLFDLRRFRDICRADGDLSRFLVGHVDTLSKFRLPRSLISRASETEALDKAFASVVGKADVGGRTGSGVAGRGGKDLKVVNVYGLSGSGKSKLVEVWTKGLESTVNGQSVLVGTAKLDQHLRKPLSGFIQLLQSLLDRVFSDPKEDAQAWRKKILGALSSQGSVFLSLVSPEWRAVLLPDEDPSVPPKPTSTSDWELFLPGFRVWSKQLLQIFATPERPLLIVLDDIQWLAAEELKLWQDILASPLNPFENVLLVSLFRVDEDEPPASSALLSKSCQTLKIDKFQESSVIEFLQTCFHWPAGHGAAANLASFLWTETQGSPFYLRSLVTTMVRERLISFSFERLRWDIDLPSLQLHASEGVDAYLDRTLSALPVDVQQLLRILSCLPSTGFPISELAELVGYQARETENLLQPAALMGAITFPDEHTVRFSHDRNQAAAYRLIPPDQQGLTHATIARYLQRPKHIEEHLFDAVDNELLALELGGVAEDRDVLVRLVCQAAERAARSASHTLSHKYLVAVEKILDFSDRATWGRVRPTCFVFFELFAEVAAVLKMAEPAIARIQTMVPFCETRLEELKLQTLLVRLRISNNDYAGAVGSALEAIRRAGLDPANPSPELVSRIPKTPQELDQILSALDEVDDIISGSEDGEDEQFTQAVIALCGFVGPSVYVTQPPATRDPFFTLSVALSLGSPSTLRADASCYSLSVYSIAVVNNMALRKAFVNLSLRVVRPGSFFECAGVCVCVLHTGGRLSTTSTSLPPSTQQWLHKISMSRRFRIIFHVVSVGFQSRLFGRRPFSSHLPQVKEFYVKVAEAVPVAARVLIDISLQAADQLAGAEPSSEEPWNLDGAFVRAKDFELVKDFPMHSVTWWMNTLRLALLFGAPREVLSGLYAKTLVHRHAVPGLTIDLELRFVLTVYSLIYGDDTQQADVDAEIAEIARHSTIDWLARLKVLSVAKEIRTATIACGTWVGVVAEAERQLSELLADGFGLLAGLTSSLVADFLKHVEGGGERLATGYARTAYRAYASCEAVAVARSIQTRWPAAFATLQNAPTPTLPSQVLTITPSAPDVTLSRPPLPEGHNSNSTLDSTLSLADTSGSVSSRGDDESTTSGSVEETLDNLTFMRSSLILAGEKDPEVLITTLMKILCQFVRSDYGAIALLDSATNTLRLKGAGAYSRLSSFDLDFSHPDAAAVAPTSLLLHVNRTKKSITSVSQLQKLRRDAFYGDRLPRSILVLPLQQQGRDVGVLLLSSKTVVTPSSSLGQVTEVVSCLATFAAIALESSQSTAKLERTVSERTAKLQEALTAKSSFLNQMSHELRTPLFAVLGLAAVLEDSAGLDSVQREHLATIRTSGEDLQTLISNVLDYSRLESGSLQASQLESIPFSLREVCELTLDSVSTIAQRKGVELVVATPVTADPPYQLIGDPFRVKQILLNLLSNSVKFTAQGSVSVSWEIVHPNESHSFVSIHVKDTGVGIPPQKMDRLFKSFSQIDSSITRSYGGSGLGLAISQSLAQLLGGNCTATSSGVGTGSTFTFSFLASQAPPSPSPFAPFRTPRSAFVLAAESVTRRVSQDNLAAFGLEPVQAAASFSLATDKSYPASLGSTSYDVILICADAIQQDEVLQLQRMQPVAKFIYLTRSVELAKTIDRLQIPHSSIVPCSPIKTNALYSALVPAVNGKAPRNSAKASAIDPDLARRHPLKILLVDDNSVNLSVGTKILERFGYRGIVTAADGQLAVEACERERFSLVLMDLAMPVMDGYEANKRIAVSPLAGKPIVVALSANTDDRTRRLVDSFGFFFYLSKPMMIPVLARVLVEAHQALISRPGNLTPAVMVPESPERMPSPSKKVKLELPVVD